MEAKEGENIAARRGRGGCQHSAASLWRLAGKTIVGAVTSSVRGLRCWCWEWNSVPPSEANWDDGPSSLAWENNAYILVVCPSVVLDSSQALCWQWAQEDHRWQFIGPRGPRRNYSPVHLPLVHFWFSLPLACIPCAPAYSSYSSSVSALFYRSGKIMFLQPSFILSRVKCLYQADTPICWRHDARHKTEINIAYCYNEVFYLFIYKQPLRPFSPSDSCTFHFSS